MACGDHSDFCNVSGGVGYRYNPSYTNSVCYQWQNISDCGGTYYVNNAGCHHDQAFHDFTNYGNVPFCESDFCNIPHADQDFCNELHQDNDHNNWPNYGWQNAGSDYHSHSNCSECHGNDYWDYVYENDGCFCEYYGYTDHTDEPHADLPFCDQNFGDTSHCDQDFCEDYFWDWNDYSNQAGYNFCNHNNTG